MKTNVKSKAANKGDKSNSSSKKEIKTDMPMSEKDEVKNAEDRTRRSSKDHL